MKNYITLLISVLILALSACSGSSRSSSLNHLINSDFKTMKEADYKSAVKQLSAATKLEYPAADESRSAGPRSVLALDDGVIVVSALRGAVHISFHNAQGKRQWQHSLTLGKYQVGEAMSISKQADLNCYSLKLAVDMGASQHLVFAVDKKQCVLVRTENANGQYAGAAFAKAFPIFKYSNKKIEGSQGITSLQALLRLSAPKAKAERSQAAVGSQLEAFATSTNAWIAEAAAAVLILP